MQSSLEKVSVWILMSKAALLITKRVDATLIFKGEDNKCDVYKWTVVQLF